MQNTQMCPVCGKEQIPMDRQECPQCNADLTCFQVLDALQEQETVRPGRGRSVWQPVGILAVFLVISLGMGWMFYQNLLIMQSLKDNRSSLEYVDRSMQALMRKVESVKERNKSGKQRETEMPAVNSNSGMAVKTSAEGSAVKPKTKVKDHAVKPESAQFFWYETTDKDTVWGISERFYQSGRYYPVLLIMNPQISIYEIKAGQRLKILKNQKDAITAFNRSITRKGVSVYLWYQVQGGDTPKTISRKFYKTADQYFIINRINPNLHLAPDQRIGPGQRIMILLPDLS